MQILRNSISALNVELRKSPKFPRLKGNRGRGTRWWRQISERKWKYGRFVHAQCIHRTVRSLWTWLWGRCHVPQNVFLVAYEINRRRKMCACQTWKSILCFLSIYWYYKLSIYQRSSVTCFVLRFIFNLLTLLLRCQRAGDRRQNSEQWSKWHRLRRTKKQISEKVNDVSTTAVLVHRVTVALRRRRLSGRRPGRKRRQSGSGGGGSQVADWKHVSNGSPRYRRRVFDQLPANGDRWVEFIPEREPHWNLWAVSDPKQRLNATVTRKQNISAEICKVM